MPRGRFMNRPYVLQKDTRYFINSAKEILHQKY